MHRLGTIRNRFLIFAALCLIPLAAVGFVVLREVDTRTSTNLASNETGIAAMVTGSTQNFLTSTFRTIENIAVMPAITDGTDLEAVNRTLTQARTYRPEYAGLFTVDVDGNVVAQAGIDTNLILPSIGPSLESTLTTGLRSVSKRIDLNLNDSTSVIVLVTPIVSIPDETVAGSSTATPDPDAAQPGDIVGAIGAVIPVDYVQQSIIPATSSRTDVVLISGDQVMAATGDIRAQEQAFMRNLKAELDTTTQLGTESFRMEGLAGSTRLATYSNVQSDVATWAVVITAPLTTSTTTQWVGTQMLVVAIAGAVILIVAFAIGELMARGFEDVIDHATSLVEGDFTRHLVPRGHGEAHTLGVALTRLQDHLITQQTQLQERQAERQFQTEEMRELLRRNLRVQEEERRHIAAEIHDAVSPLITGALYQNRALQINGDPAAERMNASLTEISSLLERASEELHEIIFHLRPPDLDDIGVVAAVEAFVQTIQRTGLEARLEVSGTIPSFTAEVRLGIYRIVQEALHNVLRHADADEAVVRLEYANDTLRVTIRDNGIGFDPAHARRPTSLGLLSMRERATAIGATFEIISRPGAGTAIVIERKDTGTVMSDELLEDILRQRMSRASDSVVEAERPTPEVATNDESSDNSGSDQSATDGESSIPNA